MILRKKRASLEIATDCNDDFGADAQSEEEGMLKKAIQGLRPTRAVVQIQQLQERSMRETAEAIGISLAAAKVRLFHAKNALRRSMIPILVHQPRFANGLVFCPRGDGSRRANARTDQRQCNHKEAGNEHVIETKEKGNYRTPSNLYPGGDGRGFARELDA